MRTSRSRLVVPASALALAAALAAVPAANAEKADREKPVQVLADRLTADDTRKEAVYEGNVIVTQGTMRLTAAKIVVREDAEGYRAYTATGGPLTFRQKRDKVDDWIDGVADRAVFDDRDDLLKLYGNAKLTSSQGELAGDFISYDRGKEFFEVTGAAPGAAPAPGSRVKAIIIPQKKDAEGKPVPAAPSPPLKLRPETGTGGKP
jgi:lipopolysaccharide export system protein LptA